jgi:Leucine-rich repeat (LRR) protein
MQVQMRKAAYFFARLTGLVMLFTFSSAGLQAQVVVDTVFLMQQKVYHNLDEALEQPDSVYILNLSREKLTAFPQEVFRFKNLRILDLSRNRIEELPADLSALSHLNGLDLSNNKIRRIPPAIADLQDLVSLQMNRNVIDSLPPEIGKLTNLEVLELWDNEINYIPEEIKGLYNLKVLELRGILFNEQEQIRIKSLLPEANVFLSPSCNCKY